MNNQASIGNLEFFCIVYLYSLYYAMNKCLGIEVLQDAWIATIIAGCMGIALTIFYYYLYSKHKGKDIFQGLLFYLGNVVGKIFIILYGLFFLTNTIFTVTGTELLLKNSVLNNTKPWQISLPFILLAVFFVYLGMQTISRTSLIFLYVVVAGLLMMFLLLLASRAFKLQLITPMLEYGIAPVFKASLGRPLLPFLNMVVIMLIFPYVKADNKLLKHTIITTIISAVSITLIVLVMLITLHPIIVSISQYPFLETSFRIDLIENFLHRIDPVVVVLVLSFSLMNLTINFYGSFKALNYVFKNLPVGITIILMGFIIFVATFFMSEQIVRNTEFFTRLEFLISLIFGLGIPIVLFIVYSIIVSQLKKKQKMQ